ncbi:unnamed protein product [Oikopleura dioica]|uniref:T-complex protein 1 subunit zeta n=2 Tax=Oikopleura dioica TaxID=34765 RepID=E4WYV6_OIKDI|nr:unnamed protein product [Oikopleura dioica]
MAAIKNLNPKAELARNHQALAINISAARGLRDVMKTNLGPKGTMKMLVSGAGDIKLTKDGNVLLNEMQIQSPPAMLIAKCATALDDTVGDGTSQLICFIGELLKEADSHIADGVHPRLINDGFRLASVEAKKALEDIAEKRDIDRDLLLQVARTSLRTKLDADLAEKLTEAVVDAILAIKKGDEEVNLHMVEIMEMQHRSAMDTQLIKGLVLDHGARHPDMPKRSEKCYILAANVSLEYEKTEVNSGFFYKTAEEREKLVKAERAFTDQKVQKIIDFKKQVCKDDGEGESSFILINQKGIDPISLDALAKENIVALRRAKRRNMERLALACGGHCMNSVDDMTPDCLGKAGLVYEAVLGENKFTFVEDCVNPQSVTLLIRGPNRHTIAQIKDAIRDGLRSVKNCIDDKRVVPGAGAFEVACHQRLIEYSKTVTGRQALGVRAYADALLVVPKTLAINSGHDAMDVVVTLQQETRMNNVPMGIDLETGEAQIPGDSGIWDNFCVKKQILDSATVISEHFLLIDEIMRAGLATLKAGPAQ